MTATPTLSNNSSSSTRTAASSSSSSNNNNHSRANTNTKANANTNASGNSDPACTDCYYCAHLKLLRDVIPPKRCDYCRTLKCQFCTLKFPLISVKKKVLPKVMKSNSRICVQCFSHQWQENGLSSAAASSSDKRTAAPASDGGARRASSPHVDLRDSFIIDASRPSSFLFDSARSRDSLSLDSSRRESMVIDAMWAGNDDVFTDDATDDRDGVRRSFVTAATDDEKEALRRSVRRRPRSSSAAAHPTALESALAATATAEEVPIVQSLISAVDLWISIFAATILTVIVVLEGYSLQQRVCFCVATYGVFLMLHPWFHKPQSAAGAHEAALTVWSKATSAETALPPIRRMSSVAEEASGTSRASRAMPAEFRKQKAKMAKTLRYYLSDECPWKVVKTTHGGVVSEMAKNDTPFPIFKIEMFITGASMTQFMDFVDSKNVMDRARWDLNVAKFEMVETFTDEPGVSVCLNTQKPFLRGLVAARDFCLLYVREDNCISFSSVAHLRAPVAADATRGNVFLSCFHCHAAAGEDGTPGFILTYICQVDIGGSLPPKLLYNGTLDNMVKMVKVFKSPKKLLRPQ